MNYISPKAVLVDEKDPFKKIEIVGRTCYKSEDKIAEGSAKKFTCDLVKEQAAAMLEHQVFVFEISASTSTESAYVDPVDCLDTFLQAVREAKHLRETNVWGGGDEDRILVSGSVQSLNESTAAGPMLRALKKVYPELVYGNNAAISQMLYPDIFAKIVDIDEFPELKKIEIEAHKNFTFRFFADHSISHELARHGALSFAQENADCVDCRQGLSIALPEGYYEKPESVQKEYDAAFWDAEQHYCKLIGMGEHPQQARAVLPTGLKTEVVMTLRLEEWLRFFNMKMLGTTDAPHPDIKAIIEQTSASMREDPTILKYRGFWEVFSA